MTSLISRTLVLVCATLVMTLSAGVAQAASTYAKTRYPVVLVHGMSGFDSIVGVDYFYQIPADLRANGAVVLVAEVSQFNDNDIRGEQLLKQLQDWSASKGYKKFNLIGHSQGGPTARYVAGVAPQLVASLTSVGSPHSMPAQMGADNPLGQLLTNYASLVAWTGAFVDWLSGNSNLPQDPAALQAWAENTAAFNARFPDGAPTRECGVGPERSAKTGIYYYSAAGNKPKTNSKDVSDLAMTVAEGVPSDGLVPVCSTHWGKVLRDDYPWNHFDEMNHVFGLLGFGAPDPVAFYRQQVNRLKLKGL
jgi:triacylglycerol lipase